MTKYSTNAVWPAATGVSAMLLVAGCAAPTVEDDGDSSAMAGAVDGGEGTGAAAECPSVEEFQEACACDSVEFSWGKLGLGDDESYSEMLTIFVEGDAESVAAAACARTLDREDIVDTHVYPLSGRSDGSTSVTLSLADRSGLVGYSLLSGDRGHSLAYAYFVVSDSSDVTEVALSAWGEADDPAE